MSTWNMDMESSRARPLFPGASYLPSGVSPFLLPGSYWPCYSWGPGHWLPPPQLLSPQPLPQQLQVESPASPSPSQLEHVGPKLEDVHAESEGELQNTELLSNQDMSGNHLPLMSAGTEDGIKEEEHTQQEQTMQMTDAEAVTLMVGADGELVADGEAAELAASLVHQLTEQTTDDTSLCGERGCGDLSSEELQQAASDLLPDGSADLELLSDVDLALAGQAIQEALEADMGGGGDMHFSSVEEALDAVEGRLPSPSPPPPRTPGRPRGPKQSANSGTAAAVPGPLGIKMGPSVQRDVERAARALFSKRTRTLYHWMYPETPKSKLKASVASAWDTLPDSEKLFYMSQVMGRFGSPAGSLMVNPQLEGLSSDQLEVERAVAGLLAAEEQEAADPSPPITSCRKRSLGGMRYGVKRARSFDDDEELSVELDLFERQLRD